MRRTSASHSIKATHSATKLPKFDAQGEIAALKARITRLERRFEAEDDWNRELAVGPSLPKTRRGPKAKHPFEIHENRDMFVRFFEQYWPEIEPHCGPNPNIRALQAIFKSFPIEKFGQLGETALKLSERIAYLEEFLSTPKFRVRFRSDPRALAGALAGVPGVGLWRSLKLCPPRTCTVPMNDPAMRSYLERRHPDIYRRLTSSTDLLHVTAWWKEYQTRDKAIKNYKALDLIRVWNAGGSEYIPIRRQK
jgi:hypothetical protein